MAKGKINRALDVKSLPRGLAHLLSVCQAMSMAMTTVLPAPVAILNPVRAVFGDSRFRSEIIWKRTSAHSDTKQGRRQHGRIYDVLLYYTYRHSIATRRKEPAGVTVGATSLLRSLEAIRSTSGA